MAAADFWQDPDRANKVVAELKATKAQLDPVAKAANRIDEAVLLWEMAQDADDQESRLEVDAQLDALDAALKSAETLSLLSGPNDHLNCFLSIYAGDGGTEANDWAEMLMRMYLRYVDKQGWKTDEVDKHPGDEAGIKDVTLRVAGPHAYGYLRCERGTHRLARVSPFNAQGKRQTSFATVDVVPELEAAQVQLDEKELDIAFFARSAGPGGQNVNKLATACRIVHRLTGISVVCSTSRSQVQNRKRAMAILLGKLEQLEEQKRESQRLAEAGGKLEMGWGTQIRSYVFYDNRVKDTRTGFESGNPQRVLDGDLHGFVEAELQRRAKHRSSTSSV